MTAITLLPSTSNPHRRNHRRLRVRDNQKGAGGETPLSETRRRGIRHTVVQSSAIAVARRARARPLPPGPRPGPSRHHCRPPLPPARAEPRPPHLVPSGLDIRPPHPCQEFREPPCPPPCLPPTVTTTPTTSAASTPRWNRRRRTTGRGPPSPRHRHPHRPQRGGGGVQNTAPCRSRDHTAALSGTSARSYLVVVIVSGRLAGRKQRWWWLPGAEAAAEEAVAAVIIG